MRDLLFLYWNIIAGVFTNFGYTKLSRFYFLRKWNVSPYLLLKISWKCIMGKNLLCNIKLFLRNTGWSKFLSPMKVHKKYTKHLSKWLENFYCPVRISAWLWNLEYAPKNWNPKLLCIFLMFYVMSQVDTSFWCNFSHFWTTFSYFWCVVCIFLLQAETKKKS